MSQAENGVLNRPYLRFLIAAVVVTAAFLLRYAMVHYIGVELPPFITFYPAVMIVAMLGGFWPGLLATVLASLLADYWIFSPIGHFAITGTSAAFGLAFFFAVGVFMSVVAELYRRNGKKLAAIKQELALRESKKKLRQTEEQFQTLANAIPQLCWMANADGWITWYNERWYSYTGTTPKQMEGWGWQSVHDLEALPKVMETWKVSIATGEPFDMVFPLRGADGVFRPFLTRVMPVKDPAGKVIRWFGTNTDISELRRAEEALRESEQRYRLLFETMLDGFAQCRLIYDQNGRPADFVYVDVNNAFGKLTGLHDVVGKRYSELFPGAREQNPELLEAYARVVSTGQPAEFEIYFEPLKIWFSLSVYRTQAEHFVVIFDNITERKKTEDALRQLNVELEQRVAARTSELAAAGEKIRAERQRLFDVLETLPAMICLLTQDYHIAFANRAFRDRFGESQGRHCYEYCFERKEPCVFCESYRVLETGQPHYWEVNGSDGSVIAAYDFPFTDVDGAPMILEMDMDITETRKAQAALKEANETLERRVLERTEALAKSEERFRALVTATSDVVYRMSPDWSEMRHLRGRDFIADTEASNTNWLQEYIHPDDQAHVMAVINEAIRTKGIFELEHRVLTVDGSLGWTFSRAVPLLDANAEIIEWFGAASDITERKRAEEALRLSEERLRITLQSIGDAVISTCAEGKVVFMNDVAQTMTGWPMEEAKGQELREIFNIVQEVTRIRPEDPVEKVIRLGKVVGLANHTVLIGRDGSEMPIDDSAAPIRDAQGRLEGVVLVFHDVSQQRMAERALRNNERLATTGRLAATIAHEIHNPLDAVGNLLYLIDQGTKDEAIRSYVGLASGELARVTQMTRQMLTFQREAAKPVPVRMGEILDSVLTLYERKLGAAGIHVEKRLDHEGEILALPGELRQVFANLVGNAVEAMRSGKGKITLHAHASRDWRDGRDGVRVVVADNGPGIPVEVRSKIFDPFFTTKGESGTGLGLWIAADIIRKYDGTMKLWSSTQNGRSGTCFSVFLPFEAKLEMPVRG